MKKIEGERAQQESKRQKNGPRGLDERQTSKERGGE